MRKHQRSNFIGCEPCIPVNFFPTLWEDDAQFFEKILRFEPKHQWMTIATISSVFVCAGDFQVLLKHVVHTSWWTFQAIRDIQDKSLEQDIPMLSEEMNHKELKMTIPGELEQNSHPRLIWTEPIDSTVLRSQHQHA